MLPTPPVVLFGTIDLIRLCILVNDTVTGAYFTCGKQTEVLRVPTHLSLGVAVADWLDVAGDCLSHFVGRFIARHDGTADRGGVFEVMDHTRKQLAGRS